MNLKVEIADNNYSRSQGLMFRSHLDEDAGMLFIFDKPAVLNFWGQNTFIPLDIAFIDKEDVIVKIASIERMSEENISSHIKCVCALEVNKGFFKENKITEGYRVNLDRDEILSFEKPIKKKAQQAMLRKIDRNF